MNRTRAQLILLQFGLMASGGFLASFLPLPLISFVALGIVCLCAIAAHIAPDKYAWLRKLAWPASLLAAAGDWPPGNFETTGDFHALVAAQAALIIFITANQPGAGLKKTNWNLLGLVWGFLAVVMILSSSYLNNLPGRFFLGLACGVFLLVLCRIWFRLGALGIQVVNTFILLLVLLPVADSYVRFKSRFDMGRDPESFYSYEAARKNPGAFAVWYRYYGEKWNEMMDQVMMRDPDQFMKFRFRPDTHGLLLKSVVRINHKGFRGAEIPDEKGSDYRIVALGESTTWDCTMNAGDRPWPDLLEELIRERIRPARTVQVINAGVPGATLPGNLGRLKKEILALKPDMLISYHGFNGFNLLNQDLPPVFAPPAPAYRPRPLMLLANLEYGVKLNRFKKTLLPKPMPARTATINPMESEYAKAYRQLIEITRTNGIRLVLANYSMAVNTNSDPDVVDFYGMTTPEVRNVIAANLAHSEIVRTLAAQNPDICFVDTHPDFDGRHDYFFDLVHFNQRGSRHMAETFFAGIRKTLEGELAKGNKVK